MYIDSHSHFDMVMKRLKCSESACITRLKENNIVHAVQVAISEATLQWSYDFARRNRDAGILFTLGIHPSSTAGDPEVAALTSLTETALEKDPGLLFGIGECGLDYYRMRQEKSMQLRGFVYQIELAKRHNLPLIIHIRDAMSDALEVLGSRPITGGIMHCFPGNKKEAQKVLDLGFYISFAGNVTYKNARILHETATYVPPDRILVETDAPFLTPVPYRGKINRSEYVIHTYTFIAGLRNISVDALKEQVHSNFKALQNR
jgi:TatD DNase family protein